jgi:hypothetical protein
MMSDQEHHAMSAELAEYLADLTVPEADRLANATDPRNHRYHALAEASERLRSGLYAKFNASPLLRRFLTANLHAERVGPLTEPWMALAERDVMGALLSMPDSYWQLQNTPPALTRYGLTYLADQYAQAHTYLWSYTVLKAIHACPLPSHVLSPGLTPFPTTYHAFESALDVVSLEGHAYEADGYLISPIDHGSLLWLPCSTYGGNTPSGTIAMWSLVYGRRYPEDFAPQEVESFRLPLAMLAMLQTHTTVVTTAKLPRGFRRHADLSAADAAQTVSVVSLRRDTERAVHAYNAESVAWRHKWWVSGHFRAQWIPSTQSHRTTWIAPYIKGDPDAPMLDHVYTVKK